ncbi:MAG: glycosyltransferase family 39 protein [Chloroflexi bacterium]|nr:glycosyltransferase family 39 protein [Chloroflexota bacterium]
MTESRLDRGDAVALAALLLVGVGAPLALAAAAGAVGVPSNDDWVYIRGADSLYRTGSIAIPGHTAAAVGQIVLVQPLLWLAGGASWAYTAFGLAMAALGIVATYLLGRYGAGRRAAVLAAVLVITFPGFARESASFMTDGPAFALEMLSLWLGMAWLRSGRRSALAASILVGVLGVSIREFAIAAPVAVLAVSLVRSRPGERLLILTLAVLGAAAVATVLALVDSAAINGGLGRPPEPVRLILLGPALTTLAAGLLPALVPAVGRRLASFSPLHLLLGVGLVAIAFSVPTIGPLVGQFWMPEGLIGNAMLSGTRDPLIHPIAWSMSEALAVLAAVLLAAVVVRWAARQLAGVRTIRAAWKRAGSIAHTPTALLLAFAIGYVAELGALISMAAYPLDRYLVPMIPIVAILLASGAAGAGRPRWSRPLGHAALAWLGASALVIGANSFAYDAARWRAGAAAVGLGYAPETVDAGYEWAGFHRGEPANADSPARGLTWYWNFLLAARPCAVLSNSPLDADGYHLVHLDATAYRQYLVVGPSEPLYLYGAVDPACPALPAP